MDPEIKNINELANEAVRLQYVWLILGWLCEFSGLNKQ